MTAAAEILADIHSVPIRPDTKLLRPADPLLSIYNECLEMSALYFRWKNAEGTVCSLLESMIRDAGRLAEDAAGDPPRCIVNTELNSGNFLINESGQTSYLIDWEKPLLSEPAQDLAHFLAPTTTLWKTSTVLTASEIRRFTDSYRKAARERIDTKAAMGFYDFVVSEIHGVRPAELIEHQKTGGKVFGTFCIFVPDEVVFAADAIATGLCGGSQFWVPAGEKVLPKNMCPLIKASVGARVGKTCPFFRIADM